MRDRPGDIEARSTAWVRPVGIRHPLPRDIRPELLDGPLRIVGALDVRTAFCGRCAAPADDGRGLDAQQARHCCWAAQGCDEVRHAYMIGAPNIERKGHLSRFELGLPMLTLAERLKRAMQAMEADGHPVSQADLARACEAKPASVSDWFTGETKELKAKSLVLAAELLGVRARWLLDGTGPMKDDQPATSSRTPSGRPALSLAYDDESARAASARAEICAALSAQALALASAYDSDPEMRGRIKTALHLAGIGNVTEVSPEFPQGLHKGAVAPAGRQGQSAPTPPGQAGREGAGNARRNAGKRSSGGGDDGRH